MRYTFRFILSALLLLNLSVVHSSISNHQFDIRNIGYAEGLSSQRVFSIVQDKDNAIWIATKEGIDRYNGRDIKQYTLPGILYYGDMAGRTLRLSQTVRYGLWAYDNTGKVYFYSESDDVFKQYMHLGQLIKGGCVLNKLYIDGNGNFWFCTNNGLFLKKTNRKTICVIAHQNVNDIVQAGHAFYAGTSSGVIRITGTQKSQFIKGQNVQTLYFDAASRKLWLGTFNNGLFVRDIRTSNLQAIKGQTGNFFNPIRAITNYNQDMILIGIDGGGVYAVDKKYGSVSKLMNAEDVTDSYLRGNGIYAVTTDSQGNIWIGSYTGGVSTLLRQDHPIKIFVHEHGNANSLKNDNVNKIEQNTNGDVWFATDLGISIRHSASGLWKHILNNIVVVPMCKGQNGCIWAGTYGKGVYLLDANGNILQHLSKESGQLATNYILAIKQDIEGDLWIGGLDGSLQMVRKGSKSSLSYNIKWSQSIEVVSKNKVAVSTVTGFYVINKRNGEIVHYLSPKESRNKNTSIYIDAMLFNGNGTVWLGTEGGGLNLYNMRTHALHTYTTHDGLPSNDIYSLLYDNKGRLWVSTGKGLAMITRNHVSNLNYLGDVDKEYNKSSATKFHNGEFAFGSSNGAVLLSPDLITENHYKAPLRFTSVTVDYSNAKEENRLRPSIYRMLQDRKISLDYAHNSFNVNFEAINYRFQRDIVYQYLLKGYDQHWSEISSNGTAFYSHVAPGSYLFKVRCLQRSDGKIISEKDLQIAISQPWWNSLGAWTTYLLLAGLILYFIIRYKSNQLQKRYDEDKINFFTRTAHDIRTPVTLIMAPLEDLEHEEALSAKARNLLSLAHSNTNKLYTLITQLLDFEKFDIGHSSVTWEPLSLNPIMAGEIANFKMLCDKKRLHLHFQMPEEDICISADRHLIEMVLDNLISNACKYTPSGGNVWICVNADDHKVTINIKDDGIGISSEARKHLFKEVYRAKNAIESQESGTGFGLLQVKRILKVLKGKLEVHSEENAGSTFSATFKRIVSYHTEAKEEDVDNFIPESGGTAGNEPTPGNGQESRNTLLIVEDNDDLRTYLRNTFDNDYKVIDKPNGQEALAYLEDEYPDLILSDVMMPGIQGDELCKRIKDNPDTSGIPVILLTAKVNHDAVVTGLKQGADDYVSKPFNTEILKLKVKGMIDNRNRWREFLMRQVLSKVENGDDKANDDDGNVFPEGSHTPSQSAAMSESDHRFVLRATQIVMDHIDDVDFNINNLCQEMAMSRTLFYSRLKSLTGKGPQEFIRVIRLQKAAQLLREGKPVSEVAADTGFINTKYFSSLFKKQFGVQPSKYSS